MSRFAHVDDQKAAGFPVTAAYEAMEVSTSGYYDWQARRAAGPTRRQVAEAELVGLIRQLFDDSDGNYGVPRVYKALRRAGLAVNYKRVERLMRVHGIAGRHRRRNPRTTIPGPDGYRIPDLVERRFDPGAPDVAWVQDITYSAQVAVICSRAGRGGGLAACLMVGASHNHSCSRNALSRSGGLKRAGSRL